MPRPLAVLRLLAVALVAPAVPAVATAASPVGTVAPPGADGAAVTVTGTMQLLHVDRLDGEETTAVVLETARGLVAVRFADGRAPQAGRLGDRVRVEGERDGHVLLASAADDPAAVQTLTAAATTRTTGRNTVAVVLLNFSDDRSTPISIAEAREAVFTNPDSARAFYLEQSSGALELAGRTNAARGDVLGWYRIAASTAGCDYNGWADQADAQAALAGVDLRAYDHVLYAFPRTSACPWGGVAYVRGGRAWLNGHLAFHDIAIHELGHNLGSGHAKAARCYEPGDDRPDAPRTYNGNCRHVEYGDPFDVMGGGPARSDAGFSAWRRHSLGWLPAAAMVTDTVGGAYRLAPTERPLDGTHRLLRIPLADDRALVVDHRAPTAPFGSDLPADAPVRRGATLRVEIPSPGALGERTTAVIDTTPGTTGHGALGLNVDDAPLLPYATFADPAAGVAVTVTGQDAGGVTLRVARAPADVTPPGRPGTPSVSEVGGAAVLSFAAATDDRGVAGYRVFRDGVSIGTTTTTRFRDEAPGSGRGAYGIRAFDAAGLHGPESGRAAVRDVLPPAPPVVAMVRPGDAGAPVPLTLEWTAPKDDVGVVGYRVFRGTLPLGTTADTTWVDPFVWGPAGVAPAWTVEAIDAAGNVSARGRLAAPWPLAPGAAPVAVANVRSVEAAGTATLRWDPALNAAGYKVFADGRLLGDVTTTELVTATPAPGARVTYTIRAFDAVRRTGPAGSGLTVVVPGTPDARTDEAIEVTGDGATLVGAVDPRFGAVRWWFEWGATTAYGSRTDAVGVPAGSDARTVAVRIGGLEPGTTYHARLVVEGSTSVAGQARSFTTVARPTPAVVVDPPALPVTAPGAPADPLAGALGPKGGVPALPGAPPTAGGSAPAPPRPAAGAAASRPALVVLRARRMRGTVVLRVRVSHAGRVRVHGGRRVLTTVRVGRPGVVTVRIRPAAALRRVTVELVPAGRGTPVRRVVRLPV